MPSKVNTSYVNLCDSSSDEEEGEETAQQQQRQKQGEHEMAAAALLTLLQSPSLTSSRGGGSSCNTSPGSMDGSTQGDSSITEERPNPFCVPSSTVLKSANHDVLLAQQVVDLCDSSSDEEEEEVEHVTIQQQQQQQQALAVSVTSKVTAAQLETTERTTSTFWKSPPVESSKSGVSSNNEPNGVDSVISSSSSTTMSNKPADRKQQGIQHKQHKSLEQQILNEKQKPNEAQMDLLVVSETNDQYSSSSKSLIPETTASSADQVVVVVAQKKRYPPRQQQQQQSRSGLRRKQRAEVVNLYDSSSDEEEVGDTNDQQEQQTLRRSVSPAAMRSDKLSDLERSTVGVNVDKGCSNGQHTDPVVSSTTIDVLKYWDADSKKDQHVNRVSLSSPSSTTRMLKEADVSSSKQLHTDSVCIASSSTTRAATESDGKPNKEQSMDAVSISSTATTQVLTNATTELHEKPHGRLMKEALEEQEHTTEMQQTTNKGEVGLVVSKADSQRSLSSDSSNSLIEQTTTGSKVFALEYVPIKPWGEDCLKAATSSLSPPNDIIAYSEFNVAKRNKPKTRKRKACGGFVEYKDDNPCRQFKGGIMPQAANTTSTGKDASMKSVKPKKCKRRKQGRFRHILLGNHDDCDDAATSAKRRMLENEDNAFFQYFIPDFVEDLHEKLTKVQVEYAWLLEESNYLYQQVQPMYIYHYASPYLKILLREKRTKNSADDDDMPTSVVIPIENQQCFAVKRRDIARKLRQGHRRGPIMSRILATLRFQNRRCTTKASNKRQRVAPSSVLSASATMQRGRVMPAQRAAARNLTTNDRKPSPVEKSTRSMMAPIRHKRVARKSADLLSKSVKMASVPSKPLALSSLQHHDAIAPPFNSHVTNDSKMTTTTIVIENDERYGGKPPAPKLLTEIETEVAWLLEESLFIEPIEGPLLSFVTRNASPTLKITLGELSGARRWLPRLYRGHDAYVKRDFDRYRVLIRYALRNGYRRNESIASILPTEYVPPPVAVRVRQAFIQSLQD